MNKYNMTDMGQLKWYLGMNIKRHENGDYTIDQTKYLKEKIDAFNITGGASTPLKLNFQDSLQSTMEMYPFHIDQQ
jgi:hypothetical protein